MQVHNDFVILSRDSSTDVNDQTLSIFKIIDRFEFEIPEAQFQQFQTDTKDARKKAVLPARFDVISSWSFEKPIPKDTIFSVSTEILDTDGEVIGDHTHKTEVKAGSTRIRVAINTQNIPTRGSGDYQFRLTLRAGTSNAVLAQGSTRFSMAITPAKEA